MKKILIDINSIVPYFACGKINGIGRTTKELVESLSRIEDLPFEITLYSQNMKGIGGRNLDTKFKSYHLYYPNREKWNKALSFFPVREWMTRYDLMHIPHNFEYVHRPQQCIITLHDALFMKMEEKEFGHDHMRRQVPPLIRSCRRVITCSEYSKKDIVETMQVSPDKIDVIPWGVRHDQFYPSDDIEESLHFVKRRFNITRPYFLSVSCNAERKRSNILVQAYMELFKQQIPNHDLVLVWANPPFELLKEIEQSNISNRIHFLSNVRDEELRNFYQASTASFNPSSYEGFGLPILEAMACGTPAVTCRNSSLPEVGGDAALYLDEPVRDSLINMMILFEKKQLPLSDIRIESIKQSSKFTWEKTTQQTLSSYLRALNINT